MSVCTELNTPAGPIDVFLVTPSGLPVLIECKLWRNPEGRRKVVGQILDYAKELSRWSSSDLQREVRRRRPGEDDPVLSAVRAVEPGLDEIEFNDRLTANLRRGRFLLLILGDGIREGVEAIAEYLQAHAGLHFSLGLVEMPFFAMPDGSHLVAPRVLARTSVITRTVVATPEGYVVADDLTADSGSGPAEPADVTAEQRFWAEFLDGLALDDPEQVIPRPSKQGYLVFMLPAPGGSSWLTVYRVLKHNEVGVSLSSSRNSAGEFAMDAVAADWDEVGPLLGGRAALRAFKDGRIHVDEAMRFGPLDVQANRDAAFAWLRERVNTFINVVRPRVRSAVARYSAS